MNRDYYIHNRQELYKNLAKGSLLVLFSGKAIRKSADEYYPCYVNRDFIYLTGLNSSDFILLAQIEENGNAKEKIYILPSDPMIERWNGKRIKPDEVAEISGITDIALNDKFSLEFHKLVTTGYFDKIYFDFEKFIPDEPDNETYNFIKKVRDTYTFLTIKDCRLFIRQGRTIKQDCEIEAMREAQKITKAGIIAMMKTSKPGMYEYQYKAEWDHALGQFGPQGSAFPPIISAGKNNFCIHYHEYSGQAHDGDMILNDVGAWYDGMMCDVSRGFPCNGKFTDKQKMLYNCALNTSDYMFSIIKPGMLMKDVDPTARHYNYEQLKDCGLLKSYDEIGKYMWHAGAHHVGYDAHDAVEVPDVIKKGMVFCIDIGIYCEEMGIGFRVEDNCYVTDTSCENLSRFTPRTISEIEDIMKK